jgi:hypothetical protein
MLVEKIRKRIHHLSCNFKIKGIHSEHHRTNANKYKKIDEIIKKYRSSGGLKHDFQGYKLFSLSELLEEERPLSILELGTGSTTAIFTDYVRQGKGVNLTCIDESENWLMKNKVLAEVSDIESRVEFLYAPKVLLENLLPIEVNYDMEFNKLYDFVFIDGPSLKINGTKIKDAINGDIFKIAGYGKPRVIVVDIRKSTVHEIIKRLGNYYEYFVSDVILKNINENYRYFSVFRLRPGDNTTTI